MLVHTRAGHVYAGNIVVARRVHQDAKGGMQETRSASEI